jgi:hypothetical protein
VSEAINVLEEAIKELGPHISLVEPLVKHHLTSNDVAAAIKTLSFRVLSEEKMAVELKNLIMDEIDEDNADQFKEFLSKLASYPNNFAVEAGEFIGQKEPSFKTSANFSKKMGHYYEELSSVNGLH